MLYFTHFVEVGFFPLMMSKLIRIWKKKSNVSAVNIEWNLSTLITAATVVHILWKPLKLNLGRCWWEGVVCITCSWFMMMIFYILRGRIYSCSEGKSTRGLRGPIRRCPTSPTPQFAYERQLQHRDPRFIGGSKLVSIIKLFSSFNITRVEKSMLNCGWIHTCKCIVQCRSKGRGQGGPCPPSFFS